MSENDARAEHGGDTYQLVADVGLPDSRETTSIEASGLSDEGREEMQERIRDAFDVLAIISMPESEEDE